VSKVTIYGASDDLVEVTGCDGADEFTHYNGIWHGDLIAPDGWAMRVHAYYDRDGCWQVGAGQVAEDTALPDWPVQLVQPGTGPVPKYSTGLTVEVPDGTRLVACIDHEDPS
jgi:hypothetical protein